MTTPVDPRIDTFRDILGAVERHPELRDALREQVLGEDILRLPGLVGELYQALAEFMAEVRGRLERLEGEVAGLKAGMAGLEARLERVEGDIAELKAGFARMEARQNRMDARQDRMEADIAELKAGFTRMEARQDRMEGDIAELKAGFARMEARQDRMEGDIAELKAGFARMEARQDRMEVIIMEIGDRQREMGGLLNGVVGDNYERQVARTARRIARRDLGLTIEARLIHGITLPDGNRVYELADRAEAEGRITVDESDDLALADMIIYDETAEVYALAEVSVTADEHDVARARRRADILARVTNAEVRAAVVGALFRDGCLAAAERENVVVVTQQIIRRPEL